MTSGDGNSSGQELEMYQGQASSGSYGTGMSEREHVTRGSGAAINAYHRQPSLAEGVISSYKQDAGVPTKISNVTGKEHPFDAEYNFLSRFALGFSGCFICGATDHFSRMDCPKGIKTRDERKMFFNEMWAHKPHTKMQRRDGT